MSILRWKRPRASAAAHARQRVRMHRPCFLPLPKFSARAPKSAREARALPDSERLANAGPNLAVEFFSHALCEKIDICIWAQRGKHGRTGARHHCSAHFWLLEQPHLELRKRNKFLEHRTLEIVVEFPTAKILLRVGDTGKLARILPTFIGPRC